MNTAVLYLPHLSKIDLLGGLARWRARAQERSRLRALRQELSALGQREFSDLGVGSSEMPYWLDCAGNGTRNSRS
ncbi:hypothetical protein [Variovorax sp. OV329]|uniref:hypothetical protein n=1 Tax=Variovorax sp. OV329 TaxID=1882825 RepID=UPI0008E4C7E8|nr:hypothetical protein [Variovorax sp. OV329]SFN12567.1 hypothetical protein SAMN05444747_115138 [Variovorax sp. OV329]